MDKKIYILENLDCAHCASKMEARINDLPGVTQAAISFPTKQLQLTAEHPDELLPQIRKICTSLEPEVKIIPKTNDSDREEKRKEHLTLLSILVGAVFFVGLEIAHTISGTESFPLPMILAFLIAYLILGGKIVWTAIRNLVHGQIFDENFLMSIATIGAFIIGSYPEAIGVMLFYRIGEYFEDIAVERSRNQIMSAADLRPEVVNRISGDTVTVIAASDAQAGDLLLVRAGDRIPLDGTVTEGESRLDTSPVTGEPVPVKVVAGDSVTSGCVNLSGVLKMRVDKVLEESMVTKILHSVENAAASKPRIDKFITRFARVYTPFVVLLAFATAILPPLLSGHATDGTVWYKWVYTALTFLVMSCPCAIVLSVPLAYFSGIGAGSKRGILFKGGIALEALSAVKAVVMDKTGTVTKGDFTLQKMVPSEGCSPEQLLTLAACAELNSTHPIGCSIVSSAKAMHLPLEQPSSVVEIAGQGIRAVTSEGVILCGSPKLMHRFQVDLPELSTEDAATRVLVALDQRFLGFLLISDTIKQEAPDAIRRIRKYGISTAMLTGDETASANAVAKATGIEEVHAKLLPEDKLDRLNDIRSRYGAVMFVGDGINDAPVLAGADVGAAMGSGADAAIEAADVVFMNSNLDAVPESIRIAKQTASIAKQNVIFALIIKAIVLFLGVTGLYSNLWLAVFADTGVAFLCILNSIRLLYRK